MTKGSKNKAAKCQRHQFSLKPIGNYLLSPQNYNVLFCSKDSEKKNKISKLHCKKFPSSTCPLFNFDNNYATPTFILPSQKIYYEQQGEKMREDHVKKMINYDEQKSELNFPKPKSKSSFCCVCKYTYDDYKQHIEGALHKQRIQQSKFNNDILKLATKYNSKNINNHKSTKIAQDRMVSLTRIQDPDDVEIISNPYKKIKTNEAIQFSQNKNISGRYQPKIPSLFQPNIPIQDNIGHFQPFFSHYHEQLQQMIQANMNISMNLNINMNMNYFMNLYPYLMPPLDFNPFYGQFPPNQVISHQQTLNNSYNFNSKLVNKPQNMSEPIVIDDD